jgi:hypothetical protein
MTGAGDTSGAPVSGRGVTGPLHTVLIAGAAAILPLAALNHAPVRASPAAISPFLPPSEPMVLTRVLRRPLPGGIEISTARSYEVRFVREGQRYRIEGELISVTVEAPRQFEALAALERARADPGMFPMRIDAGGRFVVTGQPQSQTVAKEAGRIAQGLVPAGLAPSEARDAHAFIGQTAANPIQTAWPADLFKPAPGRHGNVQVVPLPGGKTGEVSVEIEAMVDERSGLVTSLQREVTTRLGDSTRVTIETWTLAPKG